MSDDLIEVTDAKIDHPSEVAARAFRDLADGFYQGSDEDVRKMAKSMMFDIAFWHGEFVKAQDLIIEGETPDVVH